MHSQAMGIPGPCGAMVEVTWYRQYGNQPRTLFAATETAPADGLIGRLLSGFSELSGVITETRSGKLASAFRSYLEGAERLLRSITDGRRNGQSVR